MSQAPSHLEKIKALANSVLQYADQCEKQDPYDISKSEQGKQISAACSELASLTASPRNWVIQVACGYIGSMALSLILELKIHTAISDGTATTSLDELAKKTGAAKQIISESSKHNTQLAADLT
jgi:hypothetical protein